jgi:hypothetical protein
MRSTIGMLRADDRAGCPQEGGELRRGVAGDRVDDQLELRIPDRVGRLIREIGPLDQYGIGARGQQWRD